MFIFLNVELYLLDIFVHVPGDTEQQRQLCNLLQIWRRIQKVHFIEIKIDLSAPLLSTNFLFAAKFTFPSPSFLPQNLHQPFSLNAGWVIIFPNKINFDGNFVLLAFTTKQYLNTLTLLFSLLLNSNIEENYWTNIILTKGNLSIKLFKSSGHFYLT